MSESTTRPGEPEYLGTGGTAGTAGEPRRGRRAPLVGLVAAGVLGVVGLGSWAAVSFLAGGADVAEAVPANAVGFVSLDLDPAAAQKVEAVRMLQKFPAIAEDLDISGRDDLRRWVFEQVQDEGACAELDYDRDVRPWIGDRVALAAVPAPEAGRSPVPLVALHVTDAEAAADGLDALTACAATGEEVGFTVSGEYALISDTRAHADAMAAAVAEGTLAEDRDYRTWMDRVGGPGIASVYLAPGAMAYFSDMQDSLERKLPGAPGGAGSVLPDEPDTAALRRQLEKLADDFKGMAGVVRFDDGALEAEVVGDTVGEELVGAGDSGVGDLPSTTAVALGVALPDGWAQRALGMFDELSAERGSLDRMLAQAEAMTGLTLPEDLERLLGDGFAVAVDADLDVTAAEQDPTSAPVGVRVVGDPADVREVVGQVTALLGPHARMLVSEDGDGAVALGVHPDYVRDLAGDGGLAEQPAFADVVPAADEAGSVLFVDFDAVAAWAEAAGPRTREHLAPLRALGVSSRQDDDGSERALLRLTTD